MKFYIALFPIGSSTPTAEGFFISYLALPVVMLFWAGGFIWKRTGWLRLSQIDVDTGRRAVDWDAIHATRIERAAMPAWKRAFHAIF